MLRDVVSGKTANSVQNVAEIQLQLNLQRSFFFFFCYSTVFTNSFLLVFVCGGVEIKDTDTLFAVRRLKAWLRSSVTQIRPTHLVLVHVHQNILDTVDIKELTTQFIQKTPERKAAFGSV